jgi:D-methionine transport system substrate-binding protein
MIRFLFLSIAVLAFGCGKDEGKTRIKIQASSTPQAELLEYIQEDLKQDGIILEILVIDDYNIPNRALAEGEIDANFFQHQPFLDEQITQFHYPICTLVEVHIEPMGIYSKKGSLESLPNGSVITLPSDPTNETRALHLLEKAGVITLKDKPSLTVLDIEDNPKNFRFKEVDAAFLARTLDEVGASVIPTNYALLAGLSPLDDALILEDQSSTFVNVIAVQEKDLNNPELLALKQAMESEKIRLYIQNTYKGAAIPAKEVSKNLKTNLDKKD